MKKRNTESLNSSKDSKRSKDKSKVEYKYVPEPLNPSEVYIFINNI